jgi:hypothetical protein
MRRCTRFLLSTMMTSFKVTTTLSSLISTTLMATQDSLEHKMRTKLTMHTREAHHTRGSDMVCTRSTNINTAKVCTMRAVSVVDMAEEKISKRSNLQMLNHHHILLRWQVHNVDRCIWCRAWLLQLWCSMVHISISEMLYLQEELHRWDLNMIT